jgi:rhodanese-related sulfurtransferase
MTPRVSHSYRTGIIVMYFKQFLNERCGCASYVIASRKTREAAIIDPAIETEPYEALLRERGFRLRYVIDTHIHADHVSVAAQYESLTSLLRLPDWVAVFPGHFEGPCGKGMCGRPSTTIGFERLYNPLARLDRREFITQLGKGVPPRPLNMTAIEATNRGRADMEWAMLTNSPDVREVTVDDVRGRPSAAAILDVREPEEFASGQVPDAFNLPQADLATRLDEVPRDRPVFVICQGGFRSLRAAQFLCQRGYADVASVRGGTEAWRAGGGEMILENSHASQPGFDETEWTHAGGGSYSI